MALFIALLAASPTQVGNNVNFEVVGDVAPAISGEIVGGGQYDLASQRGDWVVVNFFASWCVGCRIEHPELLEFRERHRNNNVELVAVMFGDTERSATEFFEELGGDWPALVSDTGRIAIDYGVTAVPETLLISPSGRVVSKWVGATGVTADEIDRVISEVTGES